MSRDAEVLAEEVLRQNEEYRSLEQQHQQHEQRLLALAEKAVLSDDEQVEESTLKKKKLQIKDRMHSIARQVQVR